jgi:hypothetical protein
MPHILAKEVKAKLEKEFNPYDVPGLRTIQHYMSDARKAPGVGIQDQPWSLGMMDRTGIPWGAASWLLECHEECRIRALNGEQLWPLTNPHLGVGLPKPKTGGWVFLTNRQAKWLWRIHLILPVQQLPDQFKELCLLADLYAQEEITAEYWGRDIFDTRILDTDLMRRWSSKGIWNKRGTDEKLIIGKEE